MQLIKVLFNDFDHYDEMVNNWELEFNLLSKNNFQAYLNKFSSDVFSLLRTKFHGIIDQNGLTPAGFITIGIPINYDSNYFWLNRRVSGKDMLIFPKSRTLDGISYNGFDNYVISIEKNLFFQTIENLGYKNCKRIFNGREQILTLTKNFSRHFHLMADYFLKTRVTTQVAHNIMINNIIHTILKYIENSNESIILIPQKKKDIALRKAVDIINTQLEDIQSMQQLCKLTGVSERTLQYAFNDKYRVTPGEYIKAVRLSNVKRELQLSEGKEQNISYIAGKYNFWHMGQFAQDFKKQFGVLPSGI